MRYSLPEPLLAHCVNVSELRTVLAKVTWYASRDATDPLPVDDNGEPIVPALDHVFASFEDAHGWVPPAIGERP